MKRDMEKPDWDNPEEDSKWCEERRSQVIEYLERQKIEHGRVGEWPAWHITPYVSVWVVESLKRPEWVDWWVICGDCPTDYCSATEIKHPRDAMRSFAELWISHSRCIKQGKLDCKHHSRVGDEKSMQQLGPMLESRGRILLDFTKDDSLWDPDSGFLIK